MRKSEKGKAGNENYIMKLNENKQLLEENKKMILFLNKNINDITNAPFKSRYTRNPEKDVISIENKVFDLNEKKPYNTNNTYFERETNFNSFGSNPTNTDLQHTNYYYDNMNILNNGVEDDEIIILPETNLCNYNVSGQLGGLMNKYRNEGIVYQNNDLNNNNTNSLLDYKYGNIYSNNDIEKDNSIKRNTYNIDEEFKLKKKY